MVDYKNITNLDFYMCITFDFVEILLIEKILDLYEVLDCLLYTSDAADE